MHNFMICGISITSYMQNEIIHSSARHVTLMVSDQFKFTEMGQFFYWQLHFLCKEAMYDIPFLYGIIFFKSLLI